MSVPLSRHKPPYPLILKLDLKAPFLFTFIPRCFLRGLEQRPIVVLVDV